MMTAFDQHRVDVTLRHPTATAYGTKLVVDDTLTGVACTFRELSSSAVTSEGLVVNTAARIIARDWPGDEYSRVTFKGRDYDTQADPIEFTGSGTTHHWEVMLNRVPKNM